MGSAQESSLIKSGLRGSPGGALTFYPEKTDGLKRGVKEARVSVRLHNSSIYSTALISLPLKFHTESGEFHCVIREPPVQSEKEIPPRLVRTTSSNLGERWVVVDEFQVDSARTCSQ